MTGNKRVVVDAGPIVAVVHDRDQWHATAVALFSQLPKPFYTCESVVSEACYLLEGLSRHREQVMGLIAAGVIKLDFALVHEVERVRGLMKKYDDVPMSLADACLVRMTELTEQSMLFTFDGDFQIYRRNRGQRIETIPGTNLNV